MHWTRNLRVKLIAICALAWAAPAQSQVKVDLSYNPGLAMSIAGASTTPQSGGNARLSYQNIGMNFIIPFENENIGFVGGLHLMNRGTGGRIGIYDVNGAFVRFAWTSTNYFFAHIPVGVWFKQERFYVQAQACLDRYMYTQVKEAGNIIDRNQPTWLPNTLFGLHVEGGLTKQVSPVLDLKGGVYVSNTFSTGINVTPPFLNLGVSAGIIYHSRPIEDDDPEDFEDTDLEEDF